MNSAGLCCSHESHRPSLPPGNMLGLFGREERVDSTLVGKFEVGVAADYQLVSRISSRDQIACEGTSDQPAVTRYVRLRTARHDLIALGSRQLDSRASRVAHVGVPDQGLPPHVNYSSP